MYSLPIEPGRNSASVVVGQPVRRLSTPAALSTISSPSRTASCAPGTLCFAISSESFALEFLLAVHGVLPPSSYLQCRSHYLHCRYQVKSRLGSRRMPPLSSDRIVATARDLADREGLDAVTLRRLATELGVHVTSLYNHVPTLDAIIDGIIELLISDADLPGSPRNWEEWVRRVRRGYRRDRRGTPRSIRRSRAPPRPRRTGPRRRSRLRSRRSHAQASPPPIPTARSR